MKWHKTDLGGDEGEVAGIGAGPGAALALVEEATSVFGLARHAEGADEAGGEHRLLEAVRAALSVKGRQELPYGAEEVALQKVSRNLRNLDRFFAANLLLCI